MATVSKRSLRLNTYDLSAKAVTDKRLRSRKVIAVNEASPKTEIITRSKKLYMIIEDTSLKKYRSRKSHNNFQNKPSKKKNAEKSIEEKSRKDKKQEEKKIHKRRRNIVISSSISKNKHRISIKESKVTNRSTEQRQMSLQESFKRQSAKCLRPRQNKINYCDDSKLLQQHLPSQHQDSVVILERIESDNTKKVPVYKTTKTSEQSLENKNDIYDFKYDTDDRKEKLVKKKKKKNIKAKSRSVKKSVHKKVMVKTKTVDKAGKSADPDIDPIEIIQCKSPLEPVAASPSLEPAVSPLPDSIEKDLLKTVETSKVDTNVQIITQTCLPNKPSVEQIKKSDVKKPRIISMENATNIMITKAVPGSVKDILPFRMSSNISNRRPMQQYRNLNSSLLIKSLSPISKECDTFDPGSPWRPPQLPYIFSQAKHFIQSTPNETKIDTNHKKCLIKDDSYNADEATNVSDIMLQNLSDNKVAYKKNFNTCRKFGTEITNIEYLNNCMTIQGNNVDVMSEKPAANTETNSVTNVQLDKIVSPLPNSSSFDDTDDKENMVVNYQTPKKLMKKKLKKRHHFNLSPSKIHEIKSIEQNENVDPQPGPSGMRALKNCNEQRILRQSNLNNFLNLMDMPENTRISTKHGIFDDAHSSPVNSSVIKKSSKPTTGELDNAFGFCENDTESDMSPTKSEFGTNPASNKAQAVHTNKPTSTLAPVRLSLGQLRNNFLQRKPHKNADSQQMTKQQNIEANKPPEAEKNNRFIGFTNFSDTFDVLSESSRLSNCEPNVPLFMDLEPSYFSKPPQHSYKRKRIVFNFWNDSGNEEDEEEIKKHAKKKKLTKIEKENKKKLEEWVKTVNSTFQEIDEHDLLIE